ncbi:Ku protein [Streptomyces sp. NPDC004227]
MGLGYYLQPQGSVAAKPYVLLHQALQRTSKMAVARYAWHGREPGTRSAVQRCCGPGRSPGTAGRATRT